MLLCFNSRWYENRINRTNFMDKTIFLQPSDDKRIPASSNHLLLVQTKIYLRKHINNNRKFQYFFIDKDKYIFGNDSYPRNCSQKICYFYDQMNMLQILYNYGFEFYYIIEDDTFFCGDPEIITLLTWHDQSLILTGIGASGILFRRSMIKTLLNDQDTYDGLDVMIAKKYMEYVLRFRFNLNIHLYENSISHSHGNLSKSLYPQCFEYACQKGLNRYDRFNFNCKYFTKSKTNQCVVFKNDILDGYEIYGFAGKFCNSVKTHFPKDF